MSDRLYNVRVGWAQGLMAVVCLWFAILSVYHQQGPWLGLLLSSMTNAILAFEKYQLLRRKPSG